MYSKKTILNINFYLEGIIENMNKENCIVIRYEHYAEDILNLLNINIPNDLRRAKIISLEKLLEDYFAKECESGTEIIT